jgi:hypothetical protein
VRTGQPAGTARGFRAAIAAIAVLSTFLFAASAQADLYYTNGPAVGHAGLDGVDPAPNGTAIPSAGDSTISWGMASFEDNFYYIREKFGTSFLTRAKLNPDGTPITPSPEDYTFASVPAGTTGMGIDPDGSTLYWAVSGFGGGTSVQSLELDDEGNAEGDVNPIFLFGVSVPQDVESDGTYVYVSTGSKIVRTTTAGGPFENFITGIANVSELTIKGDNLYWLSTTSVGRAQLDPVTREIIPGTITNNFITGLGNPASIANDGGYLYVYDDNGVNGLIRRAQLAPNGDLVGTISGTLFNGTAAVPTGLYAIHDTTTDLSCSPDPAVKDAPSTCTATVTDSDINPPLTPKGDVTFAVTTGTGSFDATSCTLVPSDTVGTASCQVAYTGDALQTDTLTATYDGHVGINASVGTNDLLVVQPHPTTTTTVCTLGGEVTIGHPIECTAVVKDNAELSESGILPPNGTVDFEASLSGDFEPNQCTLVPILASPDSSTCTVSFDTSQHGLQTVTGHYEGEPSHIVSQGTSNEFTIEGRTVHMAVTCSPIVVTAGRPSACEVTVADTDLEAPTTPTGAVTFSAPTGSFSPAACNLVPAGSGEATCSGVTYTPAAGGSQMVTATYGGDDIHALGAAQRQLQVKPAPPAPAVTPVPDRSAALKKKKCNKKKKKKARKKCKKKLRKAS